MHRNILISIRFGFQFPFNLSGCFGLICLEKPGALYSLGNTKMKKIWLMLKNYVKKKSLQPWEHKNEKNLVNVKKLCKKK
jgi:hypothetical protein